MKYTPTDRPTPVKYILLILPALVLLLSVMPGMVRYIGSQELKQTSYMLLQSLPEGVIVNCAPLTVIFSLFCLMASWGYMKSESLAAIRLYVVFNTINLFMSSMPVLLDETLKDWPYSVFPVVLAVSLLIGVIVMIREQKLEAALRDDTGPYYPGH